MVSKELLFDVLLLIKYNREQWMHNYERVKVYYQNMERKLRIAENFNQSMERKLNIIRLKIKLGSIEAEEDMWHLGGGKDMSNVLATAFNYSLRWKCASSGTFPMTLVHFETTDAPQDICVKWLKQLRYKYFWV